MRSLLAHSNSWARPVRFYVRVVRASSGGAAGDAGHIVHAEYGAPPDSREQKAARPEGCAPLTRPRRTCLHPPARSICPTISCRRPHRKVRPHASRRSFQARPATKSVRPNERADGAALGKVPPLSMWLSCIRGACTQVPYLAAAHPRGALDALDVPECNYAAIPFGPRCSCIWTKIHQTVNSSSSVPLPSAQRLCGMTMGLSGAGECAHLLSTL